MKIVDVAVKKVYRFNCPNCQSRLEDVYKRQLLNCPYKGRFKLIVDEATQNGEIIDQYIIPGHVGYGSIYTIYYRVYDTCLLYTSRCV